MFNTNLSENCLSNVPVVFEDQAVKSMQGEETGLYLHLLPPADHLALVVETSQDQHLPDQPETRYNLGWTGG